MRSWRILLGGLIVWAFHFFGLYAIAEFAPNRVLVGALTVACLAADLWLLLRTRSLRITDDFSAWRRSVALGGAALSVVAVSWQALPALTS